MWPSLASRNRGPWLVASWATNIERASAMSPELATRCGRRASWFQTTSIRTMRLFSFRALKSAPLPASGSTLRPRPSVAKKLPKKPPAIAGDLGQKSAWRSTFLRAADQLNSSLCEPTKPRQTKGDDVGPTANQQQVGPDMGIRDSRPCAHQAVVTVTRRQDGRLTEGNPDLCCGAGLTSLAYSRA